MRRSVAVCLMLLACREPNAPPPVAREPSPTPPNASPVAREPSPVAPVVREPSPSSPAVPAPPQAPHAATRACSLGVRTPISSVASHASLARQGQELWLLQSSSNGKESSLELALLANGVAEPKQRIVLKNALAQRPRALSRSDGSLTIAFVDVRGELFSVQFSEGKLGALRSLAQGIDPRFVPALAEHKGTLLVAYAQTREQAMHTMLTRVDKELKTRDVTPVSHGAGAPTFILGAREPTLVMLDARAGVSPLLEVTFDAAGEPLPALVRTPVSQPYAPPLLSVFEQAGEPQAVFTAIGRAAATAVGTVALRKAEAPHALVPSLGYGELRFDLTLGTRAAVFVSESPTAPSLEAKRGLVVKVIDDLGEGPDLRIEPSEHSLSRPAIIEDAAPHSFSLIYFEGSQLVWAHLDCDA